MIPCAELEGRSVALKKGGKLWKWPIMSNFVPPFSPLGDERTAQPLRGVAIELGWFGLHGAAAFFADAAQNVGRTASHIFILVVCKLKPVGDRRRPNP